MLQLLTRFFQRQTNRAPDFDGRSPEVNQRSAHILGLLETVSSVGDPSQTETVMKWIHSRMDSSVRVARNKTHDAIMQAHQESVETEVVLYAWIAKYRPEAPAEAERRLFDKTYVEILSFISLLRISFADLPLPAELERVGNSLFLPLGGGRKSGPFCLKCFNVERKPYLLAHSPNDDVHLKCPICELQ